MSLRDYGEMSATAVVLGGHVAGINGTAEHRLPHKQLIEVGLSQFFKSQS
jgi:hypothetical protein